MVKRVLVFRPTLGEGGADRVTLTLLQRLDRARFAPALALLRTEGALVGDVPADVPIHALGVRRLALAAPALARVIAKTKPDVVFSTASGANVVAVIAHRLARSRARLVLSERSALFRGRTRDPKQRIEVALKRLTYRGADLVTAVSQGLADQLVTDLHLPRDLVRCVYNPMLGDDLAALAAEPVAHPWFADASVPVILACGRLVAQKDYPTLLDAFARIRAVRPARLFILGEGPLRASLEAAAGPDVCFHGFDKNPYKYMARARLLMQASMVEGLPGSLIQAMGVGTPVVATDCDFGPREVIAAPGTDSFLVPVGDAAALADHALLLLDDDSLRASVSSAAHVSARRFSAASAMTRYQAALEG